jgi:nucleolar protein 14
LIAEYASTGSDASVIIQRIHATNSVRLNHKNKEKMQNYYDVLLRRFMAVGDAIFESGNGGKELERYKQLDALTKTLYVMSQDSPECAGAVWSRRLGILQKGKAKQKIFVFHEFSTYTHLFHKSALSKRLRDVEVTPLGDACQDEFTAWPSTGMLLLMRALPHIFPSTDRRHAVVTPALLLLGQILAQTPIKSRYDVVMGLFCSGLMIEYTKGAKRIPPEATAFIASVLRLFADDADSAIVDSPLPSLSNISKCPQLEGFRIALSKLSESEAKDVPFSLEKVDIQEDTCPLAILNTALHMTRRAFTIIGKTEDGSEVEMFGEITKSLLFITCKRKDLPMPQSAKSCLAETARVAASTCASHAKRHPLQRRRAASVKELAIKTMAPRMEDPSKYSMSKDKGKSQLKAEHDRNRREYKREHKAAMRELRLDSSFIESERRKAKGIADNSAREKRHKNFAWLETEQATMNQQVRMGGGLLSGGGIGAAKAKARTGKMGIKKGGKF